LPSSALKLIALFGFLLAGLIAQSQTAPPLRLATGDVIAVAVMNVSGFNGEYTILSDGSVSGAGFGRVVVGGKTLAEAQKAIVVALSKRVKNPRVELVLKSEFAKTVYFVGAVSGGVTPWRPGMTLQKGLAQVKPEGDLDLVEVTLFRGKDEPRKFRYLELVRGEGPGVDLVPGDVISLLPAKEIRVWLVGHVVRTGEMKVREGTDLYEAVAQAGGLEKGTMLPTDLRAVLRRGEDRQSYSAEPKANDPKVVLEAGDTIYVEAPTLIKVTVAGEVTQPGEVTIRDGSPIAAGLAAAHGKTADGTFENVLLFRNGQVQVVNAAGPSVGVPDAGPALQNNDLLVVQRSQKLVYALGNVTKPSAVQIPDGKEYRVSDVLAQAGGLSSQGTLRRVVLIRPDKDGKLAVRQQFNLDEFLKDGKLASNPVVQAGDVLYFGQPSGITGNTVLQGASAALLLQTLFRVKF